MRDNQLWILDQQALPQQQRWHPAENVAQLVEHIRALGVIALAHRQGNIAQVWVDETRPLLQGGRLTAWELGKQGIPYRLICDGMAADLMARGQVDAVWVGADRIATNGDVANKIGTYSLAVLARWHGVPF